MKWSTKVKKKAVALKTKGKKPVDPHTTSVVYRKWLRSFILKNSMILEVIQVLMVKELSILVR